MKKQELLQRLKDEVIASGIERWARPAWMGVTGKHFSRSDTEMFEIMGRVLRPNSGFVDIGAHKGLVLDQAMRYAPKGEFYAFEPVPYLAGLLRRKYRNYPRVHLHEVALSDSEGASTFLVNEAAMGYSHLQTLEDRTEAKKGFVACTVRLARLDELLTNSMPDLMKIDVEGAELQVLKGSRQLIERAHPTILFEHGLGGPERFGTKPDEIFEFFREAGYSTSLMSEYLLKQPSLTKDEFCQEFYANQNYNFVAYPE